MGRAAERQDGRMRQVIILHIGEMGEKHQTLITNRESSIKVRFGPF